MPKSKTRPGRRKPQPPPRKKPKPSPKWFGVLILGVMFAGVIVILGFYGLIPFPFRGEAAGSNEALLFSGLGLIAVGFAAATRWR